MTRVPLAVRRSARRALVLLLAAIALGGRPAAAQAPAGADWPLEAPPRPLPAREVQFPPYEVRTLANGLQVVAVLHHEQPAVTMRLLVRAGAAQDPAGQRGIAGLTAQLLDQGTDTRTAQQIAEQIDSIGGALGTGSGTELSFVNAIVMKDSFATGMALLADVARHPSFAPEEIDRQKEQVVSALRVNAADPSYVASTVIERVIFGSHPYAFPGSGTPDSLARITRDNLRAFHRAYYVPNNMILAIVGDVTRADAFATAERVFGGWPRGDVPAPAPAPVPAPRARIVAIDKPDAVQTEIRVGQIAIARKHPDYMAWDLAVKILGGEGANRLQQVLRSERGLTYGASADTQAMKLAGDYVAETSTRTDTTGEALRLTIDEFARLPRQRVSDRELGDAQAYLAGSFPLTIETPNDIATQVLNAVFYELPLEDIRTFRERVLAVTPDDIQRVARAWVHPDRLAVVLVGNVRAFRPQLAAAGFTEIEVIPIEDLDLASATLRRGVPVARAIDGGSAPMTRQAIAAAPVSYVSPRGMAAIREGAALAVQAAPGGVDPAAAALLDRVIAAKGGRAALEGVRTLVADTTTVLELDPPVTSTTRTSVIYPDRFRVDATIGNAHVVQVFDAGSAWAQDPRGVYDVPAAMRDDFAASVARDTIPLLVAAIEGRLSIARQPGQPDADGRPTEVLVLRGPALDPVTLDIDGTGRIRSLGYSTPGADGRPVPTEEIFSDYRLVQGVQVPFTTILRRDGRPVMTRTLTRVTFNGPVDPSIFVRPR